MIGDPGATSLRCLELGFASSSGTPGGDVFSGNLPVPFESHDSVLGVLKGSAEAIADRSARSNDAREHSPRQCIVVALPPCLRTMPDPAGMGPANDKALFAHNHACFVKSCIGLELHTFCGLSCGRQGEERSRWAAASPPVETPELTLLGQGVPSVLGFNPSMPLPVLARTGPTTSRQSREGPPSSTIGSKIIAPPIPSSTD